MRCSCTFQFFAMIHLGTEPRENSMITTKLCTTYHNGRQTHNPSSERTQNYRQKGVGLDLLAIIGFYACLAVLSLFKKNVVTKQGNLTAIDGWRSSNWIRFVAAKVRASYVSILSCVAFDGSLSVTMIRELGSNWQSLTTTRPVDASLRPRRCAARSDGSGYCVLEGTLEIASRLRDSWSGIYWIFSTHVKNADEM